MKSEQFENAVKAFQEAVETDPTFEMPWYGLGRAHLALKQFVAASSALSRCRDLYVAQAGRQFTNQQEAQRYRQDRLTELDEMIRQVQSGPQTLQRQDQLRQLQEQRRQVQEFVTRGNNMTIQSSVPAWVSLSLGSAYFRSGKLQDAEREFKAAVDADRRSGEALNNLAVVYLETERFTQALEAIDAAKKTGFKVNPELEKTIRSRAK
jgi:tetratricopeptide (TPR) repeat protein